MAARPGTSRNAPPITAVCDLLVRHAGAGCTTTSQTARGDGGLRASHVSRRPAAPPAPRPPTTGRPVVARSTGLPRPRSTRPSPTPGTVAGRSGPLPRDPAVSRPPKPTATRVRAAPGDRPPPPGQPATARRRPVAGGRAPTCADGRD